MDKNSCTPILDKTKLILCYIHVPNLIFSFMNFSFRFYSMLTESEIFCGKAWFKYNIF